ncbi:MAG: 30S ribosomal protein S6 [Anaerolineae bacterium]
MREYELYLVLDAETEEPDVQAIIDRLTQIIQSGHNETRGEVIKVEMRGKRRLAYPIKKKMEGQDIVLNFQSPPPVPAEMERILKINERVLRYLIVRLDEA